MDSNFEVASASSVIFTDSTDSTMQLTGVTSSITVSGKPRVETHVDAEIWPGLSDPRLSGRRRHQLDVINRLHNLGAQLDIDIPTIVVIGSQSAGKSSLIDSISGITLPRASGTCTRCPIECRLVHSTAPWQCIVSLRFMVDASGKPLDSVRNVPFGPVIGRAQDVEGRLRQAQIAVLNPGTDSQNFLNGSYQKSTHESDFTKNCVSVEIKGQDVTDLSFVDLPGLIASVSDHGRDEDVEKVTELISSYISKPRCIILLTVTCETDFETQGAYRLVRQYDERGTRTIGVLTKPDRIPQGEETRWLSLVTDERANLRNGWFCVKQPSSRELQEGVTFLEARRRGDMFFMNKPWSMLQERHRQRLGSQAVARKLNECLMNEISNRFPELMQELQQLLKTTKAQLQSIPAPVSNDPVLELMHLIADFTDQIYEDAEGFNRPVMTTAESEDAVVGDNLFEATLEAHETFQTMIEASGPKFRPFDISWSPITGRNTPEPFSVAEACSIISREPKFTSRKFSSRIPGVSPSIDDVPLPTDPDSMDVGDIVELVRKATTRELPGHYPFHVIQNLISRSTDQWENPAIQFIDKIHSIVSQHRNETIRKHFERYTEGGLYQLVLSIIHKNMQQCRDNCTQRIKWLLELESHAFTLNKDHLNDNRDKFLAFFKDEQLARFGRVIPPVSEPWNPNQYALEIMATVKAYFQVASKRVIDMVSLAIDRDIVRVRKRNLHDALAVGLKVTMAGEHAYCQKLLAEPAEVVARRTELQSRLERLRAAQKELDSVRYLRGVF